nr:DUF3100 domain-containing protein [Pseudomonas fluorescens]
MDTSIAGTYSQSHGHILLKLIVLVSAVTVGADFIGAIKINLGFAQVTLLPMVWAILLGAIVASLGARRTGFLSVNRALQFKASALLQPALLLFTAKLGLMVGEHLPQVVDAGWALAFQEFGHFLGTIMLGLPVALLLGIKREAIGATFSVGREPSLAIIADKYGMNSPEGSGVLAEYLTGTILGAVFIAIFAGFVTSLGIFDPRALAMGAGVGSGSMMAAASGAIAAQQTAEVAKEVITFAAASNLITSSVGVYFTLFISLPCAVWAYNFLEPRIGRTTVASTTSVDRKDVPDEGTHTFFEKWITWVAVAGLSLVSNWILYGASIPEAVPCALILLGVLFANDLVMKVVGKRVPSVCVVSIVAMVLTMPWNPISEMVIHLSNKLNFLAITPAMLSIAGLSLAKDIPAFKRLGWRIVLVSLVANAGSFIVASIVAQIFH